MTARPLLWWALLLAAPVTAGSHHGPPSWPAAHQELRALQDEGAVPVMIVVILDAGRIVLQETSGPGAGSDVPFRWGSISKTVTALTLMEAVRQHDVSLDTPVREFLPDPPYRNPWEAEQPLRLAHLLELTTGLPDLSAAEFSDNRPLPLGQALARGAASRRLLWPPGLQHSYSNVPPGVTSAVVERLTGMPFDEAARALVFRPLGMTTAGFQPMPALPGGFEADGRTEIPYWHMTFPAFGALNATARDMGRLLQALLRRGRVDGGTGLPPQTVDRAYRMEASAGGLAGLEVGYGAGLYGWVSDGRIFYGHGGDADGYLSRFGLLPEAGRGYLVGINTDNPALLGRLRRRLEGALGTGLAPPVPSPPVVLRAGALDAYAGTYYPASVRFGVTRWQAGGAPVALLRVHQGKLEFHHDGNVVQLVPLGAGRFRRPTDPAASAVFVTREGALYLQGELGNFARIEPGPCAGFIPACDS